MCLLFLALRAHPDYPLVVAANRDEFFARPTEPSQFWTEYPDLLAGRDLQSGGTWMGISRSGRFAALTNHRDPSRIKSSAPSRGALVADFLTGSNTPAAYEQKLAATAHLHNGFNLLFGSAQNMRYFANTGAPPCELEAGVYGLSNDMLDTPWPKVVRGKSRLAEAMHALPTTEWLFDLLQDDRIAADSDLPRTGVSLEWERLLSAAFVRSADYGTRSCTVLLLAADGTVTWEERRFTRAATDGGISRFSFSLKSQHTAKS
ncbi:MAG: NRDE family protein [Rhodocyclaceae bacterium]|nr:NRDE family protein [Rhodocyclaceae bacterium]MBX3670010.1 NRDE family protein [Rhodocyclaceae bacterium]